MAAIDLTTLTTAKEWLQTTDTSSDALISRLISSSSRSICNYLNRNDLHSQSYSEAYNGTGTSRLCPVNYPITAVASVSIDGTSVPKASSFTAAGYRFSDTTIILNGGQKFSRGLENIEIVYTAGYSTIPEDIVQACVMMVNAQMSSQGINYVVSSESVPGVYSASYSNTAGSVPDSVKALLRNYVRVTM